MSLLSRVNMPVFSAGGYPQIAPADFRLAVTGLVAAPAVYTLDQIKAWPQSEVDARFASVSGFSVRAKWQGVAWADFLALAQPRPEASHAAFASWGGGYRTTVPLAELAAPRVLLCYAVEDEPLEPDYGGPLRMIIPNLWGYKSAKWLKEVEFTDHMETGYWESRGYSEHGRIERGVTYDLNSGNRRVIEGGEILDF
ncbi:MAG: molybdopterin-dependent oxidoreductase [Deltaproteobacteria bacterium]|nr:molybdopterin-dependent oxidoreductase [Deltaproteobacteria bacterium]